MSAFLLHLEWVCQHPPQVITAFPGHDTRLRIKMEVFCDTNARHDFDIRCRNHCLPSLVEKRSPSPLVSPRPSFGVKLVLFDPVFAERLCVLHLRSVLAVSDLMGECLVFFFFPTCFVVLMFSTLRRRIDGRYEIDVRCRSRVWDFLQKKYVYLIFQFVWEAVRENFF